MSDWSVQFSHLRHWYAERERAESALLCNRRGTFLQALADMQRTECAEEEIDDLRAQRLKLEAEVCELERRAASHREEQSRVRSKEVSNLSMEVAAIIERHSARDLQQSLDDVAAFLQQHHHFDLKQRPLSELRAILGAGQLRETYLREWQTQLSALDARLIEAEAALNPPERSMQRRDLDGQIASLQQQLQLEHGVSEAVLTTLKGYDASALRRLLDEVIAPYEADLAAEKTWLVPANAGARFPALQSHLGD